jgi:hypothetical protein
MSKKHQIPPEFAELLARREKPEKKKQGGRRDFFPSAVTNLVAAPTVDFNFECGCFGTEHAVVNNCMQCGRVVCAREGERPCPFCGELVLSNATLADPERLEAAIAAMEERIGRERWTPVSARSLEVAQSAVHLESQMLDLDTDWFDAELLGIFSGGP